MFWHILHLEKFGGAEKTPMGRADNLLTSLAIFKNDANIRSVNNLLPRLDFTQTVYLIFSPARAPPRYAAGDSIIIEDEEKHSFFIVIEGSAVSSHGTEAPKTMEKWSTYGTRQLLLGVCCLDLP